MNNSEPFFVENHNSGHAPHSTPAKLDTIVEASQEDNLSYRKVTAQEMINTLSSCYRLSSLCDKDDEFDSKIFNQLLQLEIDLANRLYKRGNITPLEHKNITSQQKYIITPQQQSNVIAQQQHEEVKERPGFQEFQLDSVLLMGNQIVINLSSDSSGNSFDSKKYIIGDENQAAPLSIMIESSPGTTPNHSSQHQRVVLLQKSLLSQQRRRSSGIRDFDPNEINEYLNKSNVSMVSDGEGSLISANITPDQKIMDFNHLKS